jgi:hypothetical protein
MRSISDFADETYDLWTDSDEELATDIKSILDWCPGEIRSRQIERTAPAPSYESVELPWEKNRRKSFRKA